MVNGSELSVLGIEQGAARNDPEARLLAPVHNPVGRLTLDDHGADKGAIRPREVLFRETPHIRIHKTKGPFPGQ